MIDVIPARPWMADKLHLQQPQVLFGQAMTRESLEMACAGGMALAGVEGTRIVGMAGIFERWPGCGLAWALLADDFANRRFSVFKLMQRALDTTPYNRVEAYVAEEHAEGSRLLDHLGFAKEGTMRKFWQDRDYGLFAKVR